MEGFSAVRSTRKSPVRALPSAEKTSFEIVTADAEAGFVTTKRASANTPEKRRSAL
jgi:hypothetical protein